jgi:hypothetical protein
MKYDVGDTVVVRTDLEVGKEYDGVDFGSGMLKYLGKNRKIKRINTDGFYIDNSGWAWSEEMIDYEATSALKNNLSPHYDKDVYEPLKIIDHYNLDFYEGNVLKYLLRWRKKNGVEDLKKAADYLNRLIEKQS